MARVIFSQDKSVNSCINLLIDDAAKYIAEAGGIINYTFQIVKNDEGFFSCDTKELITAINRYENEIDNEIMGYVIEKFGVIEAVQMYARKTQNELTDAEFDKFIDGGYKKTTCDNCPATDCTIRDTFTQAVLEITPTTCYWGVNGVINEFNLTGREL